MKKIITFCLIALSSLSLTARNISDVKMERFSRHFKHTLKENSLLGFFCYATPDSRRIVNSEDFNKEINLGDSSNIITNYLAYKLEDKDLFDRYQDLRKYAQIFNYKAKQISFSDLISSTAGISKHLDKIYPSDAASEEYFDFLAQLNPDLFADSDYVYSKLSNLGAIYALSYSQSKKTDNLMADYENLLRQYLNPAFSSLRLTKSKNNLDIVFSMNLRDFTEYLARESEVFTGEPDSSPTRGKVYNGWIFSEINSYKVAMVGGTNDGTFLIANFYDDNISIAFFIEKAKDEKARRLTAYFLQEFAKALN